jgi:hypothetical protein
MKTVFKYARKIAKFVGTERFAEIAKLVKEGGELYEKGEKVSEGILKLHGFKELCDRTKELVDDGNFKQIFRYLSKYLAFTIAAIFDPTGLVALAQSMAYPKCYKSKYYWVNIDKYVDE